MRALSPAQNIRLRRVMQRYLADECGVGLDGQPNVSELARRLNISQPAARAILKGGGASFATASRLAEKTGKSVLDVIGPFEEQPGENLRTKAPKRPAQDSGLFREFLDWFYGSASVVQAVEKYRQEITVNDLLAYWRAAFPPATDSEEVMRRVRQLREEDSPRSQPTMNRAAAALADAVKEIVRSEKPVVRTSREPLPDLPRQPKGPPPKLGRGN